MTQLQTIGNEFHKGFSVKIYYTEELEIKDTKDKNLFQILYIDEGSVIVGEDNNIKTLITPVLLCLNYIDPQKKVHISNAKGFSIFFMPEAINHGLLGSEIDNGNQSEVNKDYLATEQLLIYPFLQSNKNNPVNLPVNGSIRERLLRMSSDIKDQFCRQPDDYWPCRGRSFVIEMLMLLQSLYKLQIDNSIEINATNKNLLPILKEIHISYNKPRFSINDLKTKQLMGKGFKYLKTYHEFKKSTGTTPKTYLENLRLAAAESILKNTMLKVSEIARRCGFTGEEEFTQAFLRVRKMTPLSWRAQFPNPYG